MAPALISWQPKLCGALVVIASTIYLKYAPHADPVVAGIMVTAGVGLLTARQNNRSSEDVGIRPKRDEP